ncbi:MAG: hemerythrin domain-containing protein [Brachybacterium paraconglomeratum]|nr:hemerythrin domain-containing protein [Brachybacterium paraconglomeratum]
MTTQENHARGTASGRGGSGRRDDLAISRHRVPGKPWVYEMVIAHRLYREEFAALPRLVATATDRKRAALLRKHYDLLAFDLHHHHTFEDEHFWPVIAEREPLNAEIAHRMEAQHGRVAKLLAVLPGQWDAWQRTLDPARRAVLVENLTSLAKGLHEHLADEEAHMLPIMERVLSVEEWKAFADYLLKALGMRKLMVTGGIAAEYATTEELDEMVRDYTASKVWAIRHVGIPRTRRYLRKLRAGAPA